MKLSIPLSVIALLGAGSFLGGCASQGAQSELTMATIAGLQSSGAVLPFNQLNADVLLRHPGSEVAHAALDKDGDHYLYQASLIDPNKMQWYVEVDAGTGQAITDRQE